MTIQLDSYELEQLIAALDLYARSNVSDSVRAETISLRERLVHEKEPHIIKIKVPGGTIEIG